MIASAEGVIFSLLLGPTVLYLLWRWAKFSAELSTMKPRIPSGERAEQFNEDSPGFPAEHGPG